MLLIRLGFVFFLKLKWGMEVEVDVFEAIVTALRELDIHHEFDAILGDAGKLKQLQVRNSEEIQKTLVFLSEFGHLTGVIDKLKRIKRDAEKGKLTGEDLRKSIQEMAGVSSDELLEIYKIAHALFCAGKFDQAAAVFAYAAIKELPKKI
jgi:hypothetical protein